MQTARTRPGSHLKSRAGMRHGVPLALLLVLLAGCMPLKPLPGEVAPAAAPATMTTPSPPATTDSTALPTAPSGAPASVQPTTPVATTRAAPTPAAPAALAKPAPVAAPAAPRPTPGTGAAAKPAANASTGGAARPVIAAPAPAVPAPAPAAVAAPPKAPTAPALDLAALEQRLRDTRAIGVFTKLSMKNQVDDLLNRFRAFYKGQPNPPLNALRQQYELLFLKVLTVVQDGDPPLANAIASSRETIWGILTDPKKFAQISS